MTKKTGLQKQAEKARTRKESVKMYSSRQVSRRFPQFLIGVKILVDNGGVYGQ